jgi:prevent-host-death family protein
MRTYTYSEARQNFSSVLDHALNEQVIITRKGGQSFVLTLKKESKSPFDVPSIKSKTTTNDILNAIRESRES